MSQYYKLLDGLLDKIYIIPDIHTLIGKALDKMQIQPYQRLFEIHNTLKTNPEKMDWTMFSINTNSIPAIKKAIDKIPFISRKIDWEMLSLSASILTYDYEKIRAHCLIFKDELIASFYAPKNLHRITMNPGFDERWI